MAFFFQTKEQQHMKMFMLNQIQSSIALLSSLAQLWVLYKRTNGFGDWLGTPEKAINIAVTTPRFTTVNGMKEIGKAGIFGWCW